MPQFDIAPELASAVLGVAYERGLRVSRDTHFDARNLEVSWWHGNTRHAIDFQPDSKGHIVVLCRVQRFGRFGRLQSALRRAVPMFPHLAQDETIQVDVLWPPLDTGKLPEVIRSYVRDAT